MRNVLDDEVQFHRTDICQKEFTVRLLKIGMGEGSPNRVTFFSISKTSFQYLETTRENMDNMHLQHIYNCSQPVRLLREWAHINHNVE